MNTDCTRARHSGTSHRNSPIQSQPYFCERRVRQFGTGYTIGSGYTSNKRYTQPWGSPRFVMG